MENTSKDLLIFYSAVDKYDNYEQLINAQGGIMVEARGELKRTDVLRVRQKIARKLVAMRHFARRYHDAVDRSCGFNSATPINELDQAAEWRDIEESIGWTPPK